MSRALRSAALGFALVLACAIPCAAQTLTNSFAGLSGNSKEPIDIESDVLVVHDKDKLAIFEGNVKAVQGTTTLRARQLNVHYLGGDKLGPGAGGGEQSAGAAKGKVETSTQVAQSEAPAQSASEAPAKSGGASPSGAKKDAAEDDNGAKITKIEAKGDVVITSDKDQTTKSDWALYDVPAQLVTVGGNVVLTQGENVLKGDRLVIDLKTGESRFENTANTAQGGRIRALFMPKGATGKDTKSGDGKAGAETEKSAKRSSDEDEPAPSEDAGAPMQLDPTRR